MFDHDAEPAEIIQKSYRSSVFAHIAADLVFNVNLYWLLEFKVIIKLHSVFMFELSKVE